MLNRTSNALVKQLNNEQVFFLRVRETKLKSLLSLFLPKYIMNILNMCFLKKKNEKKPQKSLPSSPKLHAVLSN